MNAWYGYLARKGDYNILFLLLVNTADCSFLFNLSVVKGMNPEGGGGGLLPYKGLMGSCGQPGYVFRDFCLKQGIEFIIFCLNQGIVLSSFVLNRVSKIRILS